MALGSWLSGYFIIVSNAFMQHPVGYRLGEDGVLHLDELLGLYLQSLGVLAVRPQHGGLASSRRHSSWPPWAPTGH